MLRVPNGLAAVLLGAVLILISVGSLHAQYAKEWTFPSGFYPMSSSQTAYGNANLFDVDGDGRREMILLENAGGAWIGLGIHDGATKAMIWHYTIPDGYAFSFEPVPVLFIDADNDGVREAWVGLTKDESGRQYYVIRVIDWTTGALEKTFDDVASGMNWLLRDAFDWDDDGAIEVVLHGWNGDTGFWCAEIWGTDVATAAPSDGVPSWGFSTYPNPFAEATSIKFESKVGGVVRLKVYDIAGRLVFEEPSLAASPGLNTFSWDGRTPQGQAVASGTYFATIESSAGVLRSKITVVR